MQSKVGLNLGAHFRRIFGGTPKTESAPVADKLQVETATPTTVRKRTVQAQPEVTATVLAAPAAVSRFVIWIFSYND